VLLAVVLAVVLASAGGCKPTAAPTTGTTTPAEKGVKGGTLSFYVGEPAYIDPYNTQESEGTQVEQALFDSLTEVDPLDPTKVLPAAAETWTVNADATVWTFKLNPADKFHDGTPVTAKDFIYAFDRIANPKTVNTATSKADPSIISYHLAVVKGFDELVAGTTPTMSGLKAIDDTTLEITLSSPFADFDYVVAHPALAPVPQKYVEAGVDYQGKKVPFGEMPIGNGPFKMSEPWVHNQAINVVRNDDYYGKKPYLDGIAFRIFKDPETAYTDFEAGNLDFTQITTGKIKADVAKYGESPNGYTVNPGKQVLLGAENATYYLILNNKTKYIENPNLRKAISLAINRQAICDTIFEGTRVPADNIVPPGIAGYEKGAWADAKYDVAGAQAALTAAGYPGGKGLPTLTLAFNSGGGHEKIMQLIQADLKAVGINTTFASADFPTYLKQLDAGKFQIARLGWVADYPIMDNFLYPLFDSKSADNKSFYVDPTVDAGITAARGETDAAVRITKYQEVNKTAQAANPVAPIMFYRHHHVGSERVNELTYSAQGLADFTSTWLTNGGAK
jgi:peptide/nickel transport system substrate-binding protein/oligopeptide transport system substrate-binding protein